MSRAKPWKIVNGDLTLYETPEPTEITKGNNGLWYYKDNDLFTKFPNIKLFKKDFPNSAWNYKNNDLNNYSLEFAKFKKDFPYNVWKLEDEIENDYLMINTVKNVAKFKKDFPYNVWKYKNEIICDDEELNISVDTDVMDAFSNAADLTGELVIPKQVESIEDYAFINTNLTHVLVPSECLFNPT